MSMLSSEDASRELRIKEILHKLGLSSQHLDNIKNLNPSADLSYHGYQHLLTVAINCFDLGEYYFSNGKIRQEIRLLVLAGLYHDWDHTGGQYEDSINIAKATVGMVKHVAELEDFSDADISKISKLISMTEFPHRGVPVSLSEKIIRDADLLQFAEEDFDRWAEGLTEESGNSVTVESTKKFLEKQTIYTSWAKTRLFSKSLVKVAW